MSDAKDKAAEFRREAALCLEVADRVSIREVRERMMELAGQLLGLAEQAEAKEGARPSGASEQVTARRFNRRDA